MKRWMIYALTGLLGLTLLIGLSIYGYLRLSLPILEGNLPLNGLEHKVQVQRDALGVPYLRSESRPALAQAMGFLHAQERFFQIDLMRRSSSGRLSQLLGNAALPLDKRNLVHDFESRAERIFAHLPAEQKNLLESYAKGVNQGLMKLDAPPFEYSLLQASPLSWRPQDSLLVVFAMYLDLQRSTGDRERTLGDLRRHLPMDVYRFLHPKGSQWDAALDGTQYPSPELPGSGIPLSEQALASIYPLSSTDTQEALPGSNSWAVSGQLSENGAAIVANDMHLGLRVPNTWYRASIEYQRNDQAIRLTGVSLPGTPLIVAGSNGHIAWGFTNSYGDWSDVITLQTRNEHSQYLTPQGWQDFTQITQQIPLKNGEIETLRVRQTVWGPVIGENGQGELLAYRWVAHDIQAINLNLMDLEGATDVYQALDIAPLTGLPAQNFVVGDAKGNIAWSIMGPIPDKQNQAYDDTPKDWSQGGAWSHYLKPEQYPKIINPEQGRLWTANARLVGEDALAQLGNGGYALGARAQQIRDDLMAKTRFSEGDMLDIHLDDRALFLTPWKALLQQNVLKGEDFAELKPFIDNWQGRASTDSVGYLFVHQFRLALRKQLMQGITQAIPDRDPSFNLHLLRHQLSVPLWQLVNEQPTQWLPDAFDDWDTYLQHTAREVQAELISRFGSLKQATWGAHNQAQITHPMSQFVPLLGLLTDMPATPLAGDTYMPRVQGKSFGASQRFAVSPGFEQDAFFHMPTSQASHPLSPYYGAGHQAWVEGEATPFLPGPVAYTLNLLPQ